MTASSTCPPTMSATRTPSGDTCNSVIGPRAIVAIDATSTVDTT
ncbi:Uncharacterised protein [Mycobacteroides abscessus subsp. abscessus]|nr:Uncharacterised protein [Mycobacteroides abscessus subsp. abscessus]